MNVFTCAGRLTKDAEQRFTTNEKAVTSFTVATDVGYGDRKHALFIQCSLWGKRGEALLPHLKKGVPVTVSGELDLREWSSSEKSGTSLDLNVSEVALQGGAKPRPQASAKPEPQAAFDDDDIPFSQEAA